MTLKEKAAALLERRDALVRELRDVNRELSAACNAYGREQGYILGYHPNHLQQELNRDKENDHAMAPVQEP